MGNGEWGKERRTYVDTGLDARFGAGALEYNVESTRGLTEGEDAVGDGLCAVHVVLEWELVLMGRRPRG